MNEPVTTIRNLGPAMAQAFAKAGITSAEEVRCLGAEAAYQRLIKAGLRPHFIGFYSLAMGLQGRPWNDCQGEEKAALREKFDALVAHSRPEHQQGIEAILDKIGVGQRST